MNKNQKRIRVEFKAHNVARRKSKKDLGDFSVLVPARAYDRGCDEGKPTATAFATRTI